MATYTKQCSKVGSFSYANNFILYVELTERNVSINDNTSYVDYNVYCQSSGSGSISARHLKYFSINGEEKINATEQVNVSSPNAYIPIASGSIGPIKHNDDGSKTIPFEAKIEGVTFGVSASLSGNFTLTTIQRKSQVSLSGTSITLGNALTIYTNRASNNFKHSLYWQVGSGNWNTIATNVEDSYPWTVPLAVANSFPSSPTGTVNIICETYNGSTYIGTTTTPLSITVPDNIVPTISSVNVSGGINGIYVEKISTVTVNFSALGAYNSAISQYKVELLKGTAKLKESYGSTVTLDLNNLNISQDTDIKIRVYAIDTRNRTAHYDTVINIKRYIAPRITSRGAFRCDSTGKFDNAGTYLRIYWAYSTTEIEGLTIDTPIVKYQQKGSDTWTTVTIPNATYVVVGEGKISTDYQYEVQYSISDGITATPKIATDTIPTGYTTVDYRSGGKGIAFGKVSEKDEFECDMTADFKKEISWNSVGYSDTDYNTMKKSGIYYMTTNCTNAPENKTYMRLLVMGASDVGDLTQMATNVSTGQTWLRGCVNGTWNEWTRVNQVFTRSSTANFNSFTETGIYISGAVPTGANIPIPITGVLEVINSKSGIVTQRYTTYNGTLIYQRGRTAAGVWSEWVKTAGTIILAIKPSTTYTLSGSAWTDLLITLNAVHGYNNSAGGLLGMSNNGIKIGAGIKRIKVSASIAYYNYPNTGETDLKILKNSIVIGGINGVNPIANQISSIVSNSFIIDVTAGDLIQLCIVKNGEENMDILADNGATSLTVEAIN